jgi:hypothetical protein
MPDAVRMSYADIRTVRTRKTFQAVFEGPIEQMGEFMRLFGPPQPDAEIWAAIARLKPAPQIEAHPDTVEDKSTPPRTLAQTAAFLGTRQTFRRFLMERRGEKGFCTEHDAKHFIYEICGISSRTELNTNEIAARKFSDLRADYRNWLHGVDPRADPDSVMPRQPEDAG